MQSLDKPLSDAEIEQLGDFLLERIEDDTDTYGKDEGILDISNLDGLFTAIVSGPTPVQPSRWMSSIWGDFEPVWKSKEEFETILNLLMRYMNSVAVHLMNEPETFEPIYMQRSVGDKTYTLVEDWCFGFMTGVELNAADWDLDSLDMKILIAPISTFGSEAGWALLEDMGDKEIENIRRAITPNVREIHAYWLARRADSAAPTPLRHSEPKIGRNDPCPCGSGKKFKKCCLH